jgi:L-ascorbate metabolism protein UlaG (beta-lactamase superfamily)
VKPAFQKDAALLADVGVPRSHARLWWLGQSGFLLRTPEATVLFDPYLSDSLTRKYAHTDRPHVRVTERVVDPGALSGIDVITSSHTHTDHLDAETILPLLDANPRAVLLVARANEAFTVNRLGGQAGRLVAIDAGESVIAGGARFHAVAAAHDEVERDEAGRCRFLCLVAEVGRLRVFHSGDTRLHDGLVPAVRPLAPHVALVPINGRRPERRVAGNMDGREAAGFARAVGARLAVPHHYDMFAFNSEPPDLFETECIRLGQPFAILRNGEGLDLDAPRAHAPCAPRAPLP